MKRICADCKSKIPKREPNKWVSRDGEICSFCNEMCLRRFRIFDDICQERTRQIKKFGHQLDVSLPGNLAILAEEFGEVAKEVVEFSLLHKTEETAKLEEELIQTAAVCVQWVEKIRLAGEEPNALSS